MDKSLNSIVNPNAGRLNTPLVEIKEGMRIPTGFESILENVCEGGIKPGELFLVGSLIRPVSPSEYKCDMIGNFYNSAMTSVFKIEEAFTKENPNATEQDIRKHVVATLPNVDKVYINMGIQRYTKSLEHGIEIGTVEEHEEALANMAKLYFRPEDFRASGK